MSGIFMMSSQGPDPEDNITTTYVPGLDKLRREARFYMSFSAGLTTFLATATVIFRWGEAPWYDIAMEAFSYVLVFVLTAIAGSFFGRYLTYRELSRAKVRVAKINLEEGGDESRR